MDAICIGEKLRKLRGTKTQATVAAELGISKAAMAMYETGERVPKDDIKVRLAAHYGTTVGSLFYGE